MSLKFGSSTPTTVTFNGSDVKRIVFNGDDAWAKPYTLTISEIEGVDTITVNRTSSHEPTASIGVISNGNSVPIYHGDMLTLSATAEEKYGTPTVTSPIEVIGNINTADYITAGDYKKYTVTIISSNTTYGTVSKSTFICKHGTVLRSNATSADGSQIQVVGLSSEWIPSADSATGGTWVPILDLSVIAEATAINSAAIDGNFDGWTVDGVQKTTFTHTVTGNITITARFSGVAQTYTVTINRNDTSRGTVSQSSVTYVPYGTQISASGTTLTVGSTVVTATPNSTTAQYTYGFNNWSGVPSDRTVKGNITVTANFTATVRNYTVTFVASPSGYGTISPASVTVPYGTSISGSATLSTMTIGSNSIKATAASQTAEYDYSFGSWTVPDGVPNVGADMTITANFTRAKRKYAIGINGSSYGTVKNGSTVITSGATVDYGTILTITPTAATGYTTTASSSTGTINSSNQLTVDGAETITFTRTANTYYVYYKQGNATSGTLPSTQSRVYPNATTLSTNNMAKSNTTANSYTVTYDQGVATSGTLPSTQTSINTTTYTKNGWTTSSTAYNDRDYANGASYSAASNLTLYPNFTTSTTNGGVTLGANTMAKSNTTANSYTVTYYQGNASSTTNLPTAQTSVNTTKFTANGWAKTKLAVAPDYANNDGTGALTENLTLYPYFTSSTSNGGVTLSSNTMSRDSSSEFGYKVTYAKGTASSTANLPSEQTAIDTRSYTHEGWATAASGSKAYNKGAATGALSANVNLYPYFSSSLTRGSVTLATNNMSKSNEIVANYVVTFDPNGGRWPLDTSGTGGNVAYPDGGDGSGITNPLASTTVTTSKVRSYAANGWTTTSGSATRTYTNGQSVQLTDNTTVYPCFSYTDSTAAVSLPSSISRTGYTLAGWALSADAAITLPGTSYTPAGNITLYAIWEPNTYWVYYKQGLATSGTLPSDQSRVYPNAVTLATNNMAKSNTTANSYTVTYANGTATSGSLPSAQTSVNTTTYTKNGWTTGSTNTNDPDYANGASYGAGATSTLTLYPNFTTATTNGGVTLGTNNMSKSNTTANSYTVAYAQGNASSTTNLPATQTSINTTTYTKNGWTTTSGSQTRTYANGAATGAMSGNITLYPCFTQSTTNGGVTVSSNKMSRSNTTESGYSVTYAQGTASSTTVPSVQTATNTRSYTQSGWATSKDGSKAYNFGAATGALSSNKTLYPYFDSSLSYGSVRLVANTMTKINTNDYSYTVTYNYGGNGQNNSTATATKVRTYTANGWTTTSGSQTQTHAELANTQLTSNLTLYPCFTQSTSGGSVTLPTPNSRTGYTFNGWYTAASGGTKVGNAGATYTPSGNVTLYAQWTINTYTITYSAMPVGVESLTIYRDGSAVVTNPTSSGSFSANYNSKVYAVATAATGYNEAILIKGVGTSPSTETTVTGNISITVMAPTIKTFTVTIARNSTSYGTVSQSSVTNVPYGTAISTSGNKLTIGSTTVTATPNNSSAQYTYSFSSWSNASGTVTANKTITANFARSTRSYTISYPAMPRGVSSFVIYKAGSAQVTNPTSAGSFTAAYNTQVYATATAATGYEAPTISGIRTDSSLPTSVTGNITVSLTAGAKIVEYKWQTVFSGSQKITMPRTQTGDAGATFNFNPYPANGTQVRITCSWATGSSQEYTRAATYDEYGNYSFTPISYTDPLSLDGAIAAQLTGLDSTHLYYTKFSQLPVTLTVTKIEIYAPEPAAPDIYPGIYGEQTITLPYGDELLIRVNSAYEVEYSTDLYTETLWGDSSDGIIHWGSAISMDYVTSTTPIHFYEFDIYNEQGYLQVVGDGNLEADYIKEYGRYMGSVWIENGNDWAVSLVDQG